VKMLVISIEAAKSNAQSMRDIACDGEEEQLKRTIPHSKSSVGTSKN
jgi:hypothetical protein